MSLQLRREVRVEDRGDQVVLQDGYTEVVLSPQASSLMRRAIGGSDLLPGEEPGLSKLSQQLATLGFVTGLPFSSSTINGLEFYDLHRRYVNRWLQAVYDHPFWARVVDGEACDNEIFGFAIEKFHYIEAAHEHMGHAAAQARGPMMPELARHFVEEYTHGDIYLRGLAQYFDRDVVLKAVPLPSTRALINFLSESAIEDSFSYYAANEVLQMTENVSDTGDSNEVVTFYGALTGHYPWANLLVRSFEAHTALDASLGHESVFKEMCETRTSLTIEEVNRAMSRSRQVVEHLVLYLDGIMDHYRNAFSPIRWPSELGSD